MSDTNRRRQIEISAQLPFKKTEDVIHSIQHEVCNHGQPYGTRQKRQGHKGDTVLPVPDDRRQRAGQTGGRDFHYGAGDGTNAGA